MKALINPSQNNLVIQAEEQEFEVASPLFWVDCNSSIEANKFRYENNSFVEYIPEIVQTVIKNPSKEELLAKIQELSLQINEIS
jgi:glycerol-3-phosphate responsive antiterminator